jgi:hypothetical protein
MNIGLFFPRVIFNMYIPISENRSLKKTQWITCLENNYVDLSCWMKSSWFVLSIIRLYELCFEAFNYMYIH